MRNRMSQAAIAVILAAVAFPLDAAAAERHPATVPPTLEIEVLDPGVDPLGNPAVFLEPGRQGQLQVDIPPVVLVHRYYYTGDRSFQGPMLPGGPSIIVAHHPQSGERQYISVQMMPGAPRVTYTAHSIDFDYGEQGTTVHFGHGGSHKVKYRTGRTMRQRVGDFVHIDRLSRQTRDVQDQLQTFHRRSATVLKGAALEVADAAHMVTLPAQNFVSMMPFGQMMIGTDWESRFAERAAEHDRDHAAHRAEKDAKWDEMSIPTVR